ncbi:hypothetical protein [Paenibacillus sp. SYP-B3998]|nr:hypothetical protein [Paenibacillus sp. SYP-B3998]
METPKDVRKQTKAINKEQREGWQTMLRHAASGDTHGDRADKKKETL